MAAEQVVGTVGIPNKPIAGNDTENDPPVFKTPVQIGCPADMADMRVCVHKCGYRIGSDGLDLLKQTIDQEAIRRIDQETFLFAHVKSHGFCATPISDPVTGRGQLLDIDLAE